MVKNYGVQADVDDEVDKIYAIGNGAQLAEKRVTKKAGQPAGAIVNSEKQHGRVEKGHPGEANGLHPQSDRTVGVKKEPEHSAEGHDENGAKSAKMFNQPARTRFRAI